jgi:hypothetical protein
MDSVHVAHASPIQLGRRLLVLSSIDEQTIKVIPAPANAIRAPRGRGRGERLVERLLETRR